MHPTYFDDEKLMKGCRITFGRASGPGGQNRNKVETAVELTHVASNLSAAASEKRTQRENRCVAVFRLRIQLALNLRCEVHQDFERIWQRYLEKNGRVNISEANPEWPILLAELLNSMARSDWDLGSVANHLCTSTSQLVKLFKKCRPALDLINRERQAKGLAPLR